MSDDTYAAVRACSIAILAGAILQIDQVSAGNGKVIDWRTVRSGETVQADASAFDTAQLFVALVGPAAALCAVERNRNVAPAPPVRVAPTVHAFAQASNGGRRRTFQASGFTIVIEPHEDDAAQAAFAGRLASLCGSQSYA